MIFWARLTDVVSRNLVDAFLPTGNRASKREPVDLLPLCDRFMTLHRVGFTIVKLYDFQD